MGPFRPSSTLDLRGYAFPRAQGTATRRTVCAVFRTKAEAERVVPALARDRQAFAEEDHEEDVVVRARV